MVDDVDLLESRQGNSTGSPDDMNLVCAGGDVAEGDDHDSRKVQEGVVEEKGFRDIVKLGTSTMGGCAKFEEALGEGQEELLSSSYT